MQNFVKTFMIPQNTVMNTTLTSVPIPVNNTFSAAVQVVFTGTPTGTFTLQASNDTVNLIAPNRPKADFNSAPFNPTHWSTIANSAQAVTAAGDIMWNLQDIGYQWIRLVYTDTGGGTSTAVLKASTFSAKNV